MGALLLEEQALEQAWKASGSAGCVVLDLQKASDRKDFYPQLLGYDFWIFLVFAKMSLVQIELGELLMSRGLWIPFLFGCFAVLCCGHTSFWAVAASSRGISMPLVFYQLAGRQWKKLLQRRKRDKILRQGDWWIFKMIESLQWIINGFWILNERQWSTVHRVFHTCSIRKNISASESVGFERVFSTGDP